MPETGLKVDGLSVSRGGRSVLSNVSVSLEKGRVLEVRGPNGSGKSSLLLALAGHIGIEDGTIVRPVTDPEMDWRTQIHYCGHQPAIKQGLNLKENLAFWTSVLGGDAGKISGALEAAGLGAIGTLDAGVLSAGQARRLALARLMVISRPLWLLDEPTSALDANGARWVGALVSRHCSAGGLAVIATHLDIEYENGLEPRFLDLGAIP